MDANPISSPPPKRPLATPSLNIEAKLTTTNIGDSANQLSGSNGYDCYTY